MLRHETACPRASTQLLSGSLDELLTREYLLTNGLGSYAAGTYLGINTRKYHGLFVQATKPPLGRCVLLSNVLARCWIGSTCVEVASFEFNNCIHPHAYLWLANAWRSDDDHTQRFSQLYQHPLFQLQITVSLFHQLDLVRLDLALTPAADTPPETQCAVDLLCLCALRDFHAVRTKFSDHPLFVQPVGSDIAIADRHSALRLVLRSPDASFTPQEDWWFKFRYREEIARGLDGLEDLYVPGYHHAQARGTVQLTLLAAATGEALDAASTSPPPPAPPPAPPPGNNDQPETPINLQSAARQFIVQRSYPTGNAPALIAGYPWFGDWARSTFIALPGVFLHDNRAQQAADLLRAWAPLNHRGLLPSHFDDHSGHPVYDSADAALWYALAADACANALPDEDLWAGPVGLCIRQTIEHYANGTAPGVALATDALLQAGSPEHQMTWMNARLADHIFTPRHGKAVELSALWVRVCQIAARRFAAIDSRLAQQCDEHARAAARSFDLFWNDAHGCCYDVINEHGPDPSIRPNMLTACLAPGLLADDRARRLLDTVRRQLITPVGLRSLAPSDPRYRPHYAGDVFTRDNAYHNGIAWPWWVGIYVEASLLRDPANAERRTHCRGLIGSLKEHARSQGCIGSISEIFDAAPPYAPRGCFAMAWSVAEIIRAEHLLAKAAPNSTPTTRAAFTPPPPPSTAASSTPDHDLTRTRIAPIPPGKRPT